MVEPHYADELVTLYLGDCVAVMAELPADSVDAIVTDPPYNLGFMGKAWDSKHQHEPWAAAALRVAKPGAHLLAFGGTRTYHRLASAIEDAGWEIRDCLVWAYASGFPKSLNLTGVKARKPLRGTVAANVQQYGTGALNIDATRIGTGGGSAGAGAGAGAVVFSDGLNGTRAVPVPGLGRWPANLLLTDPIFDGGVGGVVGGGETTSGLMQQGTRIVHGSYGGFPGAPMAQDTYGDSGTYSRFFTIPQSGTMCEWCGVSRAESSSSPSSRLAASAPSPAPTEASPDSATTTDSPTTSATEQTSWHDESVSTSSSTPSPGSQRGRPSRSNPAKSAGQNGTSSATTTTTTDRWMCDSCAEAAMRFSMGERESDARFLLVPKAARSDREPLVRGGLEERETLIYSEKAQGPLPQQTPSRPSARANVHPTVKPIELMRHLVRLVTPPKGTVLDCFLGSGTTAIAANMEGFRAIGIEREAEYLEIAVARLAHQKLGLGL